MNKLKLSILAGGILGLLFIYHSAAPQVRKAHHYDTAAMGNLVDTINQPKAFVRLPPKGKTIELASVLKDGEVYIFEQIDNPRGKHVSR